MARICQTNLLPVIVNNDYIVETIPDFCYSVCLANLLRFGVLSGPNFHRKVVLSDFN